MEKTPATWKTTTHDWAQTVDLPHLDQIRRHSDALAPGGALHLVLEVLAYAAEEAACNGSGRGVVTLHPDGSVAVADNGRGTDTRIDDRGQVVRKPVMATRDVRFFDHPSPQLLPDRYPRRGMSVVAALSDWLVHTNRRRNGSWTQRYEHGIPITDLTPVPDEGTIGTTVHFSPSAGLASAASIPAGELHRLTRAFGAHLAIDVRDERMSLA